MRIAMLAVLMAISCGTSVPIDSAWSADTGIYGTNDHFGPASYICGIAYDLHYRGRPPLDDVDVAIRYPAAFIALTGASDDWVRSGLPVTINDHDVAKMAALTGHTSGSTGGVCPNGATDLPTLRGAIIRVTWHDRGAELREEIVVDRIRAIARMWAGTYETDFQTRIEWGP